MKLKTLRQLHPEYRGKLWTKLDRLYRGGFDLTDDDRLLGELLPKHVNESDTVWGERKRCASYLNYFGDIVDFFAANLFRKTLTVLTDDGVDEDLYNAFAEDADGQGNNFQRVMAKAFIRAAVQKRAVIAVDFPDPDVEVESRAVQDALGLNRPRVFTVEQTQLLDWQKADDGTFAWAILYREVFDRATPDDNRAAKLCQFKVWDMTPEGFAQWRLFEFEVSEEKKEPGEDEPVPLVGQGVTSFRRVPLVDLELPDGLWIGSKAGPIAVEHFRRRTNLVAAEDRSLLAIPVLKLGPEIGAARGAMPSEAQQNPHRGSDPVGKFTSKGWVRIGKDDDLSFAEPTGGAYDLVDRQLSQLVDEMHRVSHLMAQSVSATGTAVGRSGVSKAEDRHATEVVLEAFGDLVGQFAVRVYDTIAQALGDDVFWTAHGLEDFKLAGDRRQLVEEATKVQQVSIPSDTFKARYKTKLALRLLGDASPEDEQAIRDEIEAAKDQAPTPPQPPQGPQQQPEQDDDGQDDGPPQNAAQAQQPPPQQAN